jgi:hypothetical protein
VLSRETRWALILSAILCLALRQDTRAHGWWPVLIVAIPTFVVVKAMLYFLHAIDSKNPEVLRSAVLQSPFARALGMRLRDSRPAPVIEVPILDVGTARVRFLSTRTRGGTIMAAWMRLQLKSPALARAPWLHLQGANRFWLPTVAVGAKALPAPTPDGRWRYWQLPWRPAECTVEDATFRAALPATTRTLALTSRPGHLVIRADYDARHGGDATAVFENAVKLAIAWVKAVQQTTGSSQI